MRNDFTHARIKGDLQDRFIVLQIDPTGRLQPEIVTGAGFRHCLVFVPTRQASHREVFDGAAAKIFQQGNRGFNRHNAVRRRAAQRTGGDFHLANGAGRRDQAIDHGFTLPQQRTAGCHAGEHLVNVLRLHLTGDLTDHPGLVRIARAEAHRERIIDKLSVVAHIGNRTGDIRVIFGEHAHQHVAFRRLVNGAGVGFRSCQHVQADAVTVKVGGQFHAFFSCPNTSLMRR